MSVWNRDLLWVECLGGIKESVEAIGEGGEGGVDVGSVGFVRMLENHFWTAAAGDWSAEAVVVDVSVETDLLRVCFDLFRISPLNPSTGLCLFG